MLVRQYSQTQLVVLYIQKRSETQLENLRCPETAKALGFSRFLFGVPFTVQAEFCVTFQRFGNIRSTQPTGLNED